MAFVYHTFAPRPSSLPAFSTGRLLFGDGTNVPTTDADLAWDTSTNELIINGVAVSTNDSYMWWSSYANNGNNVNSGAETELYAVNIDQAIPSFGDVVDFEFTGIAQAQSWNNIFYVNLYDGGGALSHVIQFPTVVSGGSGNNHWRISGKVIKVASADYQVVASLEWSDGTYGNTPCGVGTIMGLGNTNNGGSYVSVANALTLSISAEDDSGAGYIMTTYGAIQKW